MLAQARQTGVSVQSVVRACEQPVIRLSVLVVVPARAGTREGADLYAINPDITG